MKKFIFLLLFVCGAAQADQVTISAIPSAWRLENYPGDNVVVWFPPSTCANGMLSFPSTATIADRNRFFALILAAKLANAQMFVMFDSTVASCPILSFGMNSPTA